MPKWHFEKILPVLGFIVLYKLSKEVSLTRPGESKLDTKSLSGIQTAKHWDKEKKEIKLLKNRLLELPAKHLYTISKLVNKSELIKVFEKYIKSLSGTLQRKVHNDELISEASRTFAQGFLLLF